MNGYDFSRFASDQDRPRDEFGRFSESWTTHGADAHRNHRPHGHYAVSKRDYGHVAMYTSNDGGPVFIGRHDTAEGAKAIAETHSAGFGDA